MGILDRERWMALRSLLEEALELPGPERGPWLAALRERDRASAADVRILLGLHDALDARGFLESGGVVLPETAAVRTEPLPLEAPGRFLGPYRLVRELGSGGMGVVWLAEQTFPLRRPVAVKILRTESGSGEVLLRFEVERQALAVLNHPGIAKVFDAGRTVDGRPYFVLEYVPGSSITMVADAHNLAIEARLRLFLQICDAVQYAHRRGVLHRDLKPSNVLVHEEGSQHVVKLIDFGIAKLLGPRLGARTLHTAFGVLLGTPEYMSPEQAGLVPGPVDVRSDVYSLGLLLYELLAGAPPYDYRAFRNEAVVEALRTARQQEPPGLSLRVQQLEPSAIRNIAACRSTTPQELRRQLRGGLERIAARAIREEPRQRYASVADLAADIQRHLNGEIVVASGGGRFFDLAHLVRRHRARSAVTLLAATVVASTLVMTGTLRPAGLAAPERSGSRDGAGGSGQFVASALHRLTAESDAYADPALSPEGRTVAYSSVRSGTIEIRSSESAPGSQPRRIPGVGGGAVQPAFSPDGQWLAYHSRGGGGVWLVPTAGGQPKQLVPYGSMPSWSPDGTRLVFTSDAGGLSAQAVLWIVTLDGAPPVQLTRLGSPPGGHLAPAWSHDGALVVFSVGGKPRREVWVVPAEGGEPHRLTTAATAASPRFGPDDGSVYWIGSTPEGNDCLMRVRLNGRGAAAAEPEAVLPFPGHTGGGFAIGRDGTLLVSLNRLTSNLFAIDLARILDQDPVPLTDDDAQNMYPEYGPDGRLLYQQEVAGRSVAGWVLGADGRNRTPLLTAEEAAIRFPQWAPRGDRVLAVVEEVGRSSLAWIDLASGRRSRIGEGHDGGPPSLSAGGDRLAFHRMDADGAMNVWIVRLDDGSRRQLTSDPEAVTFPRWSPDGNWLAVTLKRGDRTHVGLVSAGDGRLEQLTFDTGQSWPYSFSPDGEQVAFGGEREGVWNIYAVSRRTKQVTQLTRFTAGAGRARFPAWSPAGDRIVFVRTQSTASLWSARVPL